MLGKLIRHEWKDSCLFMIILNGTILVLSILGAFFFRSADISDLSYDNPLHGLMYGTYMMVYVVGIVVLFFGSTIYFYARFYRNLYTDQGYLMHTLPVNEHELIFSKLIVAMIWKIISAIIVLFGIELIAYSAYDGDLPTIPEIQEKIIDWGVEPGRLALGTFLGLLFAFGYALYTYFLGYASVSIGQFAVKNKVIASIGAFLGIRFIIRLIRNIFSAFIVEMRFFSALVGPIENTSENMIKALAISNLLIYLVCFVLYLITHQIMKNRLNLE